MTALLLVLAVTLQQPKDTVVLKPVVVTATRTPATADVLPAAVTVLKGVDLTAKGIRTVAQALEAVPGLHIAQTGSIGGQTAIFTRGGESDYTKVLLDGVPLNQAGGGIDLAHLTTDNVDRIEIVRGPVSVLYGSDAMTGVVQIFTKTGAGGRELGAGVLVGSYGSSRATFDLSGGDQRVAYSASVSRFSADGLYPYNNQYRNSVASARAVVRPDAQSDVSLTYRYGDDSYHFPTDGFGAPVDSNQRAAERGPLLSLSAGRQLGQHLEARVNVAAKESRQFFNDEPDSPGEDGTFWSRDYVRRTTSSALVTWRANDASLVGGVEYEDQRQRGTSDFSASFGDFPDSIRVQRNNTGYFTEALLPAGRMAWTLGARLDDNSQFGPHGTYRAGVVYRLMEQARLRISAGTGFKEPTFFENFAHGFATGNPKLRPEQSFSWEVGIERGPVTVTYFNQRFRDLIEYSPTPVTPDSVNYFNVGAAVADGIEANAVYNLTHAIIFSLGYTFLHTRVEKSGTPSDPNALFVPGKPLVRRPAHTLAPELTASIGDRAHVTVGLVWVGKRDDVGAQRVTLDPYTRVNVAAEYELGRVVVTGTATNLFNDPSREINGFRPLGRIVMLGGRVALGR
ncbi:MAG TPA: TonB-dependent receptor [Gemmatimonadales bacterium]|nr:TonB-dependent receptor [Gemmatimonadales bacterium]